MLEAFEEIARVVMFTSLAIFVTFWCLALGLFSWYRATGSAKKSQEQASRYAGDFLKKHWHTFVLILLTLLFIWRFKTLSPQMFGRLMSEYPSVVWLLPIAVVTACSLVRLHKLGPYFAGFTLWLWLLAAHQVPYVGELSREVLYGIQKDLNTLVRGGNDLLLGEAISAPMKNQR